MLKIDENFSFENNKTKEKEIILELVKNYIRNYGPNLLADRNTAPVSGKVVGEEEAANLVEASLITLLKLIFNFLQTIYISFINPIFTSL